MKDEKKSKESKEKKEEAVKLTDKELERVSGGIVKTPF